MACLRCLHAFISHQLSKRSTSHCWQDPSSHQAIFSPVHFKVLIRMATEALHWDAFCNFFRSLSPEHPSERFQVSSGAYMSLLRSEVSEEDLHGLWRSFDKAQCVFRGCACVRTAMER